jgi:uroporphyrinogen-III synthase
MKKWDWKSWAKYAGIRAIKTMAQTAIATIGVAILASEVDWIAVVSASAVAGLLSLLTSAAGLPELPVQEAEQEEE